VIPDAPKRPPLLPLSLKRSATTTGFGDFRHSKAVTDHLSAFAIIVDFRIKRRLDNRAGMWGRRLETNAADIEIFLEAIELEEVGEFQSADISALCTDFILLPRDPRYSRPSRVNNP
jgi:hypothetical protein